jgi:hypothetical protein
MAARWSLGVFAHLLACLLIPRQARADGHRAEAASTYSMLARAGSTVDGLGYSAAIPLCWVTPDNDCATNYWSFVAARGNLSHTPEEGPKVEVQYTLVGVRRTWDTKLERLAFFWTLLGGGVRRREFGSTERFGQWGSGGGGTATAGAEVVLFTQQRGPLAPNMPVDPVFDIRFRAQYGAALYRIGDDWRWGHGPTFTLSLGWEIH